MAYYGHAALMLCMIIMQFMIITHVDYAKLFSMLIDYAYWLGIVWFWTMHIMHLRMIILIDYDEWLCL